MDEDDDRESIDRRSLNTDSTMPVGSLYDKKIAAMWFKPGAGYAQDLEDDLPQDAPSATPSRKLRRTATPFAVRGMKYYTTVFFFRSVGAKEVLYAPRRSKKENIQY